MPPAACDTDTPPREGHEGLEPLHLIGAPPALRGHLFLANPGREKLKFKSATLRVTDGSWGDATRDWPLQVVGRLGGGRAQTLAVHLEIDALTPVGPAEAEIRLSPGDAPRPARLQVLPQRVLAVTPTLFALQGRPGLDLRLPVVLANLGNVPHRLPRSMPVSFGEDHALAQLFHVAAARSGQEGHQAALDTLAGLLAASELPPGRAHLAGEVPEWLPPGRSCTAEVCLRLPEGLLARRRYHGSLSIGRSTVMLDIDVEPPSDDGGADAAPAPASAPAAPRRSTRKGAST